MLTEIKTNKISKRVAIDSCEDDLCSQKKFKVMKPKKHFAHLNAIHEKMTSRKNYFTPLQALCDEELDSDGEAAAADKPKKTIIPPIKVLSHDIAKIRSLLNISKVTDFLVQKISIGVKIVCNTIEAYNLVNDILTKKSYQFYTHSRVEDRHFKLVLLGLDNKTAEDVKKELIALNYKCIEVKAITKTYECFVDTLFIISFERGSVKLDELRRNVRSLFHTIIRWEHQRKVRNKLVQCRNCQMYGHGEKGCFVKTKCANCAGSHKTQLCDATEKARCANCNGTHKSTETSCPNRLMYLNIKQTIQQKNNSTRAATQRNPSVRASFTYNEAHFPAATSAHQNKPNMPNIYSYSQAAQRATINSNQSRSSNNLFTESEIIQLTLDVVDQLKTCTTKSEQFNVITKLAIKYLYSN